MTVREKIEFLIGTYEEYLEGYKERMLDWEKNDSGYNDKGAMLKSLPSLIRGLEKTLYHIDRCDDKDKADFCPKKAIRVRIDRATSHADDLWNKITRWQKGDGQNSWRSERRWAIDGIRELESALEVIRWVELQGGNK